MTSHSEIPFFQAMLSVSCAASFKRRPALPCVTRHRRNFTPRVPAMATRVYRGSGSDGNDSSLHLLCPTQRWRRTAKLERQRTLGSPRPRPGGVRSEGWAERKERMGPMCDWGLFDAARPTSRRREALLAERLSALTSSPGARTPQRRSYRKDERLSAKGKEAFRVSIGFSASSSCNVERRNR
jgi:hypothetical protein